MGIQIPEKQTIKLYRLNENGIAQEVTKIVDARLKSYETENMSLEEMWEIKRQLLNQ